MKLSQILIILGVIGMGIGALVFGAYNVASAPLPDGFPPPTANGDIEIKTYPAYRAATVQVTGNLANAPARGFSPLFRHISSNDISMTAPVETRYPTVTNQNTDQVNLPTDGAAMVSFLYRSPDIVPQEIAPNIQIEDIPPMTVVSLGLTGSYNFEAYMDGIQQIQAWLSAHPAYSIIGPPRRLFYDGPYIPDALKRSDVQIPVQQR